MSMTLSQNVIEQIDKAVKKYPAGQQKSAVKTALHLIQDEKGWVSPEDMKLVAQYLKISEIEVFEVATFYTMYELSPVGKHVISVCTNISCMLRNSDEIACHLKEKLQIDFGQTTEDNRFTLKEVECLAACGGAPAIQVGTTYHENLTCEKIDKLIDTLE